MKIIKNNDPIYKIVSNGALSSIDTAEGRIIPYLIIDIEDDTEISDLVNLHKETLPGDVELQWGVPFSIFKAKSIILNIKFLKPMQISFGVEFTISTDYVLIDGIIQSRGFYLHTGKSGDKVSSKISESGGILIEVPEMGFDKKWNSILLDTLKSKYKKQKYSKKEVLELVKEEISQIREILNIRRTSE